MDVKINPPQLSPAPSGNEPGLVNSSVYADGRRVKEIPIDEAGEWAKLSGHVVWIGLFEPGPELLARVRALLRRGRATGDLLSAGDVTLDLVERAASRAGRDLDLTPREADLLELLLRNARAVVSREQALAHVWGEGGVTANAVDRYVAYLRRKLGEPPLIRTVRGVGFVLDP